VYPGHDILVDIAGAIKLQQLDLHAVAKSACSEPYEPGRVTLGTTPDQASRGWIRR
jgi:hypothetical protein